MGFLGRLVKVLVVAAMGVVPVACAPIYTSTCADELVVSTAGPITDPALVEISGIHAGVRNPDLWWVHNDSGDSARVFAVDGTGATRGTYAIDGATAVDWEDIAVVGGSTPGSGALYLADIGDNAGVRPEIIVYRITEPEVPAPGAPAAVETLTGVEALHLVYPDGAHDAETLIVDPVFGDLVIVAKSGPGGNGSVYRAPADLAAGSTTTLTAAGKIAVGTGLAELVTAGDVTADGRAVAIRTYASVKVFNRDAAKPVWKAFEGPPCHGPVPAEIQGEAIGFRPDGKSLTTVSEGISPTLHLLTVP